MALTHCMLMFSVRIVLKCPIGLQSLKAVGEDHSVDEWLSLIMEFGQVNLKCMALLDEANTSPSDIRYQPVLA